MWKEDPAPENLGSSPGTPQGPEQEATPSFLLMCLREGTGGRKSWLPVLFIQIGPWSPRELGPCRKG